MKRLKYWKGKPYLQTLIKLHGLEEALKRLRYKEVSFPGPSSSQREGFFYIDKVVYDVYQGVCYKTPSSLPRYFYEQPQMSEKEFEQLSNFIDLFGSHSLSTEMLDVYLYQKDIREIRKQSLETRLRRYKLIGK